MSNQKLNMRTEAVTQQQYLKELQHVLRTQSLKSTNNQYNQNENLVSFNFDFDLMEDDYKSGEELIYTNKDQDIKNVYKKLKQRYKETREEHKQVVREHRRGSKKYLEPNTKSYSMVVLTNFKYCSKDYKDKSVSHHMAAAKRTMEEFCKEFDTEYEYISIHLDEKGLPHAHAMVKNFNSKGYQLNIQTNKENGEKCQDIIFNNFKHLGYDRGQSKDLTHSKHSKTHKWKANQKQLEKQQQVNNQLQDLEDKSQDLEHLTDITSDSNIDIDNILDTLSDLKIKYKSEDKMIKRVLDYTYRTFNNLSDMSTRLNNIERINDNLEKLQPAQLEVFENILKSIDLDIEKIQNLTTTTKPK